MAHPERARKPSFRRTSAWSLSNVVRVLAPLVVLALVPIAIPGLRAQAPAPTLQQGSPPGAAAGPCTVTGTVSAGQVRLPGVVVTVTPRDGGAPIVTSSGVDGVYLAQLPAAGRYEVKAELAAFAGMAKELAPESGCQARVDLLMTLASRVPPPVALSPQPGVSPTGAPTPSPLPARPQGAGAQRLAPGQFQRVGTAGNAAPGAQPDQVTSTAEDARALAEHLSLPPGFTTETLSDTVTAFGTTGQTNEIMLFGPRGDGMFGGREGMPGMGGMPGMPGVPGEEGQPGAAGMGQAGGMGPGGGGLGGGRGGGEMAGGFGGGGRGGGGAGGRGGGGAGQRGGQRGGGGALADRLALANRMRQDQPHGNASYTFGGSPLDAAPYSLNGSATQKPTYFQQRFAGSIGGQFKIPHLFDLGSRTSYFLNYSGNHSSRLYDAYSTVPSAAMRAGDFSASSAQLIDPATGLPFAGNQIPADRVAPAAQALMQYIPLPNQPGDRQNFYYSTTNVTSSDDISFRFVRTFGTVNRNQRGGGQGGGGGRGGGGGGRGGGPGGGGMNLNVSVRYHHQTGTQSTAFPTIGGTSKQTGWDIPVGFSFTKWGIIHSLRGGINFNDSATSNAFAYAQDVAGGAGIHGVSTDPFDWGVSTVSFSGFSGLRDITPSLRRTQTITFNDSMSRLYKRHTVRWGLDFRDERLDSRTDSSARGAYVFTGLFTGGGTARLTGADLADFLLGLPQQASIQYGPGLVQLRSQSWGLYVQDDWRVASNFTINAGLRYEYQSPYREAGNRMANLDVNADFTAAAAVQAGQAGPFSGVFPATLVEPDRNNLSPRVGIAWRPQQRMVVRGGYGINYSSVPYLSVAQKMVAQPPFASTDTRIGTTTAPLSLANAFATPSTATTTNNFGVDRHYSIGYVHMWNVDFQRDVGRTLSSGISYTGTKGLSLDILRAPNRGPSGLRISGVQPFTWESSGAESIMHALSLRLRKRLAQGLSLGGVYTLSNSRDNASSLGGGGGTVAQNDQDLAAEWGPSSFNQRHRFSGDFSLELPFGSNRRWLTKEGVANLLFGGWAMNGNISLASGQPFTARVTGAVSDVASGVNGTLRANYNGQPISIDNPTIGQFFNTSAFSVPAAGTFGDAGRNTITGPGTRAFNMALMKTFPLRGTRGVSVRIQATNVLNMPVWGSIDTVVNSPTFGQVVSIRSMRSIQIVARMNF